MNWAMAENELKEMGWRQSPCRQSAQMKAEGKGDGSALLHMENRPRWRIAVLCRRHVHRYTKPAFLYFRQ